MGVRVAQSLTCRQSVFDRSRRMGVRVAQSLTCRQSVFDRSRRIGVRVAQSLTCRLSVFSNLSYNKSNVVCVSFVSCGSRYLHWYMYIYKCVQIVLFNTLRYIHGF